VDLLMGLWRRSIRPEIPNSNDPADVPPATVGPPSATGGNPDGVVVTGDDTPAWTPPMIRPAAWSGWPDGWNTPNWTGTGLETLVDTAWMCLDYNAHVLSSMPPYLVNAKDYLQAGWLRNPDENFYTSWEEFAKQAFWDYQACGEAFILATNRYGTGLPSAFHVVPPWTVNAELGRDGLRNYRIGDQDVTADILHVRYQSTVSDAHGHGPLEAGSARLVAAEVLTRYAAGLATQGGIPSSIISLPVGVPKEQAELAKQQWIEQRALTPGQPAVLSGGITWQAVQLNPEQMALTDLANLNDARICALLKVPPALVGLSTGDSLTYANVQMYYDLHWRVGLRPFAQSVMAALSQWALPRGTSVELNRDAYVEPEPLQRAQTAQILAGIVDPVTGQQALTVAEIRAAERLGNSTPDDVSQGVLR
jgi:HK97 family phage portal protein